MTLLLFACGEPTLEVEDRRPERDDGGETTAVDGLTCGDGVRGGDLEECDADDDDACAGLCSTHCQCPSLPATGMLEVHAIDVWQGDAALVVSPDGFSMLVDAGDEDDFWGLRAHLGDEGIDGIDYTLVSHQHTDHMGAMDLALWGHEEIGVAFDGGGRADTTGYQDYAEAAGERRRTVVTGDRIDMGAGLTVEVVHADIGDRENENNNSVVLRLTHGEVTVLLGGDCEAEVCESAIDAGPIDVYKVHHHGSSDSSSRRLLEEMRPSVALISSGRGNDYGHPHASVLRALEEVGAAIWRTDESGDIVVTSDGAEITVEAR